jgi:CRISPR/Cas system-associated endoribonuclease Cas2
MFVLFTYDVNSKRCNLFKKLLRKYLGHEQNSVFFLEK